MINFTRLNNRRGKPFDFTITTENGTMIQLMGLDIETVDRIENRVQLTGTIADSKIIKWGEDNVLRPANK